MDSAEFALELLNPTDFYRSFIDAKIRIDGREFDDLRSVKVGLGSVGVTLNCYGSSHVNIGKTKVTCFVSLLIGTPSQQYPDSGDVGYYLLFKCL